VFHRPAEQLWRKCVNRCKVTYCCAINQFLELFEAFCISVTDCRKLRSISFGRPPVAWCTYYISWTASNVSYAHWKMDTKT
jgi:hypothetical protein